MRSDPRGTSHSRSCEALVRYGCRSYHVATRPVTIYDHGQGHGHGYGHGYGHALHAASESVSHPPFKPSPFDRYIRRS